MTYDRKFNMLNNSTHDRLISQPDSIQLSSDFPHSSHSYVSFQVIPNVSIFDEYFYRRKIAIACTQLPENHHEMPDFLSFNTYFYRLTIAVVICQIIIARYLIFHYLIIISID